jgi:C-terminal processing protease CtpA/Prc
VLEETKPLSMARWGLRRPPAPSRSTYAEHISNSQSVPLVVLVDVDTISFGEIMSGILQNEGRATVVGQTTLGNVETLWGYDLEDGSRAWIAVQTFRPNNLEAGLWEDTGIVPDVHRPTRWDLFTEATDPALATAVNVHPPHQTTFYA